MAVARSALLGVLVVVAGMAMPSRGAVGRPTTRALVVSKDVVNGRGGERFAFTVDVRVHAASGLPLPF